jgi:predicted metal-binding transcription factor (methanogenesis marker protein 9)
MGLTIKVPVGAHSSLGPSSSKRWIHCPGSVEASKNVSDSESIYAASGSATHYLSELMRKEKRPAADWLGAVFVSGKHQFDVDKERCDSAQEFVDWCEEVTARVILVEQRIDYSRFMPAKVIETYGNTFGTLDDARISEGVCTITDFKDGSGIQEFAQDNSQLMLQALGVHEEWDWLLDIREYTLRISQPRLGHKDEWIISRKELISWAENDLPGYARAVLEGTCFKAGAWCRFCRIRKTCAVRANTGVQAMLEAAEFEDLDQLETHALRARNSGHMITNEDLVKILPSLDIFKAWIKDMERRAVSELIAGDKTLREHFKLVEGRSNRRWKDEENVAEYLTEAGVEPYKTRELISVAEAEKAIGKAKFRDTFADEVVKPPGKPKLVPAADKRAEITGQALVEFDNLDDEEE